MRCLRCGGEMLTAGCATCGAFAPPPGHAQGSGRPVIVLFGARDTAVEHPLKGRPARVWRELVGDCRSGITGAGVVNHQDLLKKICDAVLWLERSREEGGWF